MSTLSHFPVFLSLCPRKPFFFSPPSRYVSHHFNIYPRPRFRLPVMCASSTKKPRASRTVKSNEDLCNDILEFVSQFGYPEGHVPSLKELSEHGRQDLANIVRRRGYKVIKELLSISTKKNIDGSRKEDVSAKDDKATAADMNRQDEKTKDLSEDVFLSSEAPIGEDDSSSTDISSDFSLDDKSFISVESSTKSSLQEKVAKFIQKGELDAIEDSGFNNLNESVVEEGKEFIESQCPTEQKSSSVTEEHNDEVFFTTDVGKILNGSGRVSSQHLELSASENGTSRNDCGLKEGLLNAASEDATIVKTSKESEVEISRLKLLLHQKELELTELKQQIEKEKLALSDLQTKAETEISKAQKLIKDIDVELNVAEERLSGLMEVS